MTQPVIIGNATLYLGDCLEVMDRLIEAETRLEVVFTDPPFSSGTRREAAKGLRKAMTRAADDAEWFGSDSLTTNGFAYLLRSCALRWRRLLVPGGHAFVFIDWRMAAACAAAIESADLRHCGVLVWDKTYFGMGACFRNQHEFILHFSNGVGRPPKRKDAGNVFRCTPIRGGASPNRETSTASQGHSLGRLRERGNRTRLFRGLRLDSRRRGSDWRQGNPDRTRGRIHGHIAAQDRGGRALVR